MEWIGLLVLALVMVVGGILLSVVSARCDRLKSRIWTLSTYGELRDGRINTGYSRLDNELVRLERMVQKLCPHEDRDYYHGQADCRICGHEKDYGAIDLHKEKAVCFFRDKKAQDLRDAERRKAEAESELEQLKQK